MRGSGLWSEGARRGASLYAGILRLAAQSLSMVPLPAAGRRKRGHFSAPLRGGAVEGISSDHAGIVESVTKQSVWPVGTGFAVKSAARTTGTETVAGVIIPRLRRQSGTGLPLVFYDGIPSRAAMSDGNVPASPRSVARAGNVPKGALSLRSSERRAVLPKRVAFAEREDAASLPSGTSTLVRAVKNTRAAHDARVVPPPKAAAVTQENGPSARAAFLAAGSRQRNGQKSDPAQEGPVISAPMNRERDAAASPRLRARSAVAGPDEIRHPQFPGRSIGVA